MLPCPWTVAELIRHSGDKILLDRIVGYDSESILAEAVIKSDSIYLQDEQEPAWMGLEYMAQAIAALAGIKERQKDSLPKIGMLIGTRRYCPDINGFPVGMTLVVEARSLLEDENGLSVFQCTISSQDKVIAQSNLNVYQPGDIQQYMKESAENE